MTDQEYNGYTNKETWRTMLLINEDDSLLRSNIERSIKRMRSEPGITFLEIRLAISREIRSRIEDEICVDFGYTSDLIKCAIDRIDFDQIATILIEESKNA